MLQLQLRVNGIGHEDWDKKGLGLNTIGDQGLCQKRVGLEDKQISKMPCYYLHIILSNYLAVLSYLYLPPQVKKLGDRNQVKTQGQHKENFSKREGDGQIFIYAFLDNCANAVHWNLRVAYSTKETSMRLKRTQDKLVLL